MVRTLSEKRKTIFMDAALKLFVQNGVKNTATAEIAKAAGAASGTLFLYFPTKQALMDALVLKISREQSDFIKSRLEPSLPARETFYQIWVGSVGWFLDHMDAYQYVRQVRDTGMFSEEVVLESSQSLVYYFDAIQKGHAEGSIKPYPVELIGGFLYQDIIAVMDLLKAQPDPAAQQESIQAGFAIFWDGIKTAS